MLEKRLHDDKASVIYMTRRIIKLVCSRSVNMTRRNMKPLCLKAEEFEVHRQKKV